jgi:hypothetical protein
MTADQARGVVSGPWCLSFAHWSSVLVRKGQCQETASLPGNLDKDDSDSDSDGDNEHISKV